MRGTSILLLSTWVDVIREVGGPVDLEPDRVRSSCGKIGQSGAYVAYVNNLDALTDARRNEARLASSDGEEQSARPGTWDQIRIAYFGVGE